MTSHRHPRFRGRSRRGALLMFVLAMLAMFGLIGFTFIMMTSHARRGARAFARMDQNDDRPDELLHRAALQIFRGTTSRASVLGPHSLLEDLYGNAAVEGTIVPGTAVAVAGGQLVSVTVPPTMADLYRYPGRVLTMLDGAAAGSSFRIVDYGNAPVPYLQLLNDAGRLNIGTFNANTAATRFLINGAPFSGSGFGLDINTASNPLPVPLLTKSRAVYRYKKDDPSQYDPSLDVDGLLALLPNHVGLDDPDPVYANEDYDAVDYQNMLLALQVPVGQNNELPVPIPSMHRPALVRYWLNKYAQTGVPIDNPADPMDDEECWRLAFEGVQPPNAALNPVQWTALRRKMMLRPLQQDHPNFDGGNPLFNPAWSGRFVDYRNPTGFGSGDGVCDYRWDVDNDGDGVEDSIWVDLGLPIQQTADGRLVKPLVAILCVDMDGRLNLNAHGSAIQVADCNVDGVLDYLTPTVYDSLPIRGRNAGDLVPRGQGIGPAEINLLPLFSGFADYQSLLFGKNVPGRYGEYSLLALPNIVSGAGYTLDPLTRTNPWQDPLHFNEYAHVPDLFNVASASDTRSYGRPPDMKGMLAVGLDFRGQPVYSALADPTVDPTGGILLHATNSPYELNLSFREQYGASREAQSPDAPFTPAELERLLRIFDIDNGATADRLAQLTGSALNNKRNEITTESWHIPVSAFQCWPKEMLAQLDAQSGTPQHLLTIFPELKKPEGIMDFIVARIAIDQKQQTGAPPVRANVLNYARVAADYLLSHELKTGQPLDLNPAFGNGLDDNDDGSGNIVQNGVIDEPHPVSLAANTLQQETTTDVLIEKEATGTLVARASAAHLNLVNNVDVNGNGTKGDNIDQALARQLQARYLYVQMVLLTNFRVANPSSPTDDEKEAAKRIAQWAVNMVDFMDRDSIMTPFEYDLNPFVDDNGDASGNPWDVDGIVKSAGMSSADDDESTHPYRGLVWGCERPELLVTETLAFHDRRTEDTDADSSGKTITDPSNPDDDFDQKFRPQGSLFVEMFNPWTREEAPPGEFYRNGGVDLTAVTRDGSPIWRLVVVDACPTSGMTDTDGDGTADTYVEVDPSDPAQSGKILRSVYFVDSSVTVPVDGAVQFRPSDTMHGRIAPVLPGRYAVIGPGQPADTTSSTTFIGFKNGEATQAPDARRFVLSPNANPLDTSRHLRIFAKGGNDDADDALEALRSRIHEPVAVVINSPQRLSVTEPVAGYPPSDPNGTAYDVNNGYTFPFDAPLDAGGDFWDRAEDGTAREKAIKLKDNGVFAGVFVLHLQRLANPLVKHDRDANPYKTIDVAPIDVVSFNGVTNDIDSGTAVLEQGQESNVKFCSRERGENNGTAPTDPVLWRSEFHMDLAKENAGAIVLGPIGDAGHFFGNDLSTTLGCLNEDFGPIFDTTTLPGTIPPAVVNEYLGSPSVPFAWFTWNNRPYISKFELLQCPKWSSLDLPQRYKQDPAEKLYERVDKSGSPPLEKHPYEQILNFFANDELDPGSATYFADLLGEPNWKLFRLLDVVDVPSRFAGTTLQMNSQQAASVLAAPLEHEFYPPHHDVALYREPGKVNVNTVFSDTVWNGLMNTFPNGTIGGRWNWGEFVQSRSGYEPTPPATPADAVTAMLRINPSYPTRFASPFRSALSCDLVPLAGLQASVTPKPWDPVTNPIDPLQLLDVEATLLRSKADSLQDKTLWEPPASFVNDPLRNPYFRYQGLQRLGNLTTTRSNVYAVWLTVGYFEVEPRPDRTHADGTPWLPQEYDAVYPDGYAIGQELGSETGDIVRHRAFYLFDRSIPVGFERGKDHNVEDAILIRRFIE